MKPDDELLPYDANDGVFDGHDGIVLMKPDKPLLEHPLRVGPPHVGKTEDIHLPDVNVTSETAVVPSIKPVSATGAPMVPTAWVPWLTVLGVVAAIVSAAPTLGLAFIPPAAVGVATAVVALLAAVGIASPGLRKP